MNLTVVYLIFTVPNLHIIHAEPRIRPKLTQNMMNRAERWLELKLRSRDEVSRYVFDFYHTEFAYNTCGTTNLPTTQAKYDESGPAMARNEG